VKFKNLVKISLLFIALNFQACSYVNTDKIGRVLSTDYYELDTTPKDSTLYQCEENKEFYLKDISGVEEKKKEYLDKNQDQLDESGFPKDSQLCSKCNTKAAILMDGCLTCLNCGESKCG